MKVTNYRIALLLPLLLSCVACGASAQDDDRTSRNDTRLKRHLEEHPDADKDKDGVLTLTEWREFRRANPEARPQRDRKEKREGAQERERPAPAHADIRYGDHQRQVIDLYLAESATPTPLVVYFHGGGFVGGDKKSAPAAMIRALHQAEISVAAVNYRLITTDRFPAPFHDAARAIQFLRHHATEYNLDPARFATAGGSAGGGISLWLAFHDDLADAGSADPVARQSSRVACAQANASQVSYDPRFWHEHGMEKGLRHPSFALMYGLEPGQTTTDDPAKLAIAADSSPIHHLTADDPSVHLSYGVANEPITRETTVGAIVHHPKHGAILKVQMDALGIECIVVTPENRADAARPTEWLIEHLKNS